MRKLYIHSTFLLVFFTSVVLQSFGQITVTKVENKNINPSSIGFYYSLPQTVLKIDIVYEKIQQLTLQKKQEETVDKWAKDKIKDTYIKINEDFKKCEFKNNWKKD